MKHLFFVIAGLFLTFTFISCKKESSTEVINLQFSTLSKGQLNGDGAEGIQKSTLVIQNLTELQSLAEKMNKTNKELEIDSFNQFDFKKKIILAAFTEIKSHGAEVEFSSVVDKETAYEAYITEPEAEDRVTTVITQPYHLISVPKTDKTVKFIWE